MPVALDLTDQRFGSLVAEERTGTHANGSATWRVRCDCGCIFETTAQLLRKRKRTSCGCVKRERIRQIALARNYRHGHSAHGGTPEYRTWKSMLRRCYTRSQGEWENYGGRGIKVCERWRNSFPAFLADVGVKPSPKHSLDCFPNKNGNYELVNVRWATPTEQARNRRCTIMITFEGKTQSLPDWADELNVPLSRLYRRYRHQWTHS